MLDPPAQILLTSLEAKALATSEAIRNTFGRWGITFGSLEMTLDISDEEELFPWRARATKEDDGYTQVEVLSAPEAVATKVCRKLVMCLT